MDKFLQKDPELHEFLDALPKHHTKIIFTNARYVRAEFFGVRTMLAQVID